MEIDLRWSSSFPLSTVLGDHDDDYSENSSDLAQPSFPYSDFDNYSDHDDKSDCYVYGDCDDNHDGRDDHDDHNVLCNHDEHEEWLW